MEDYQFIKGEMVLDTNRQMYLQVVEEIEDGIVKTFDGLHENEADIEDLEKIELPNALDLFGFELITHLKKGTEKYQTKKLIINLIDEEFYAKGIKIKYITDMQNVFQLFELRTFK